MKLSRISKNVMVFALTLALALTCLMISPVQAVQASGDNPTVTVLGATLRISEGAANGTQSLRVGIEVTNASKASVCGIKVKIKDSEQYKVVSTEDAAYKKLYAKDDNNDSIVYTVVVTGIPVDYAATDFEFVGFVKGFDSLSPAIETDPVTKSVQSVIDVLKETYGDGLKLDESGALVYSNDIDLSGATKLDGTSVYDSDSGGITVDEVDGIIIPFDLASGDSVTLTVEGSAEGSTPRIWVSDGAYTAASVIQNPMVFGTEYTITATAAANRIQVKAQSGGGKFSSLGITRVSVVKPLTVNDMPPVLYSPKDIPVSGIKVGAGTGVYDESSGIVRIEDTGSSEYYFNLPEEIAAGETVVVTVDGTWNGTYGFRFWIGDGVNSRSVVSVFNAANLPKGEFHKVMEFTATDTCKMLTLKQIATWSGGGPIDGFTLSNISITKKPAPRPAS